MIITVNHPGLSKIPAPVGSQEVMLFSLDHCLAFTGISLHNDVNITRTQVYMLVVILCL